MSETRQPFVPSKPSFNVKVKLPTPSREKGYWALVGCAWGPDEYGAFKIVLNPGCSLQWNDGLVIKLFPNTPREGEAE